MNFSLITCLQLYFVLVLVVHLLEHLQVVPIKTIHLEKCIISIIVRFCKQIYSFYKGGFQPRMQQLLLQYLVLLKKFDLFEAKSSFLSEQVIKLRFRCKNKK